MIEELVAKVFATRNRTHLAHWAARSYAEHTALGAFYPAIIEQLDALVECYQGQFGQIDPVEQGVDENAPVDLWEHLQSEMDWIDSNRDSIAQGSALLGNLIDTLSATYAKTVYLLGLQ